MFAPLIVVNCIEYVYVAGMAGESIHVKQYGEFSFAAEASALTGEPIGVESLYSRIVHHPPALNGLQSPDTATNTGFPVVVIEALATRAGVAEVDAIVTDAEVDCTKFTG